MKKIIVFLVSTFIYFQAQSQNQLVPQADSLPFVYIGTATGINNYCALLGVGANVRVYDKLFIRAGVGTGVWGTKYTIGIKFDRKYTSGWSYGVSYSFCPGEKNIKTPLEVTDSTGVARKADVFIDYLQASTINLSAAHNWVFHKKNYFFLELGYAIPMQTDAFKVRDNQTLSDVSKSVLSLYQPGGLILSFGIMFGI